MVELRTRLALWTCWLTVGCAQWPTWRHLDPQSEDAASASTPPGDALWQQTSWTGPVDEAPNNEFPTEASPLLPGSGWIREGALQGWGWDPSAAADKDPPAGCVGDSDFPPTRSGDYEGDLDWFGVAPSEPGTLCAAVRLAPPDDVEAIRYDLLLYQLDECRTPVAVWRDPVLATDSNPDGVLGFTLGALDDGWGVPIDGGGEWGIVLAGVWPNDEQVGSILTVPWTLSVALVATGNPDEAGLCPALPEDL